MLLTLNIVSHNPAQSSSDNISSQPPDNRPEVTYANIGSSADDSFGLGMDYKLFDKDCTLETDSCVELIFVLFRDTFSVIHQQNYL